MIMILSFSVLITLLIGIFLICCLWPNRTPLRPYLLIIGFLAVGLGIGVCSDIFFFWLIITGQSSYGFIVIEATLALCLAATLFYRIKRAGGVIGFNSHAEGIERSRASLLLKLALCVALASATFVSIHLYRQDPHGGWDALSVWNMRARFIFRGGPHWRDGFSTLLSHPDYPLLLPLSVARSWQFIGNDSTYAPALLAFLFTFATIGLVASSLSMLRTNGQGLLAALLLLGTPFLIKHGASQYADIPLAFFLLAGVVLLCLSDALPGNNSKLITLAGMAAGFAAWTKNEGLLFLVSMIAARFMAIVPSRGVRAYFKEMAFFSAGLLLPLIAVLFFKLHISPPNDLLSGQAFYPTIERLSNVSRYYAVLKAFVNEFIAFGGWRIAPVFLLVLYPLVLGIKIEESNKKGVVTSFYTMCIILAGYFFIYVTTPEDLTWHLSTSLNRLLLHVWPTFVFTYFLVIQSPEGTIQTEAKA